MWTEAAKPPEIKIVPGTSQAYVARKLSERDKEEKNRKSVVSLSHLFTLSEDELG